MNEKERYELLMQFVKQAEVHEEQCRLNYAMAVANTCTVREELRKFEAGVPVG